jgi:hypothetical protein
VVLVLGEVPIVRLVLVHRGVRRRTSGRSRVGLPALVCGQARQLRVVPGRWLVTTVVDMTDPDSVRASDSEREAAVERLRAASVEGRLTFGELTTRTEAAYSAQTRGELARITSDLPDQSSGTAPAQQAHAQQAHAQRIVSIFADVSRSGWWRAEGTVSPMSLFGDVELDLRQAAVPTGEVRINAVAPFGDIEVIVPDGVGVELTGSSVFGRKKVDVRRPASIESAPVVRVRAVTVFGSVLVRS